MKISFKKDQLNFLDMYVKCTDSKSAIHEKFKISGKEGDTKIIFSQLSSFGYLITEMAYNVENSFEFIFDTLTFSSLIKSVDKETDIFITESGIEFNGNKYDINNEDIEIGDVYALREQLNNITKSIKLKDIEKFNSIKDYVGAEGLDTVAYQNGYFVVSNKLYVTAFTKTDFKDDNDIYFSSDLFSLLYEYKFKEIDINFCDEFYYCKIENTFILILNKGDDYYILPNMFDPQFVEIYNHPYSVKIEKSKLVEALSRMRIIARNNRENRIFISIIDNEVQLINNDSQYAIEKIKTDAGNQIAQFPVSVNYFLSIISNLTGKEVYLYYNDNIDDLICANIKDENMDRFYLLNLLEG